MKEKKMNFVKVDKDLHNKYLKFRWKSSISRVRKVDFTPKKVTFLNIIQMFVVKMTGFLPLIFKYHKRQTFFAEAHFSAWKKNKKLEWRSSFTGFEQYHSIIFVLNFDVSRLNFLFFYITFRTRSMDCRWPCGTSFSQVPTV